MTSSPIRHAKLNSILDQMKLTCDMDEKFFLSLSIDNDMMSVASFEHVSLLCQLFDLPSPTGENQHTIMNNGIDKIVDFIHDHQTECQNQFQNTLNSLVLWVKDHNIPNQVIELSSLTDVDFTCATTNQLETLCSILNLPKPKVKDEIKFTLNTQNLVKSYLTNLNIQNTMKTHIPIPTSSSSLSSSSSSTPTSPVSSSSSNIQSPDLYLTPLPSSSHILSSHSVSPLSSSHIVVQPMSSSQVEAKYDSDENVTFPTPKPLANQNVNMQIDHDMNMNQVPTTSPPSNMTFQTFSPLPAFFLVAHDGSITPAGHPVLKHMCEASQTSCLMHYLRRRPLNDGPSWPPPHIQPNPSRFDWKVQIHPTRSWPLNFNSTITFTTTESRDRILPILNSLNLKMTSPDDMSSPSSSSSSSSSWSSSVARNMTKGVITKVNFRDSADTILSQVVSANILPPDNKLKFSEILDKEGTFRRQFSFECTKSSLNPLIVWASTHHPEWRFLSFKPSNKRLCTYCLRSSNHTRSSCPLNTSAHLPTCGCCGEASHGHGIICPQKNKNVCFLCKKGIHNARYCPEYRDIKVPTIMPRITTPAQPQSTTSPATPGVPSTTSPSQPISYRDSVLSSVAFNLQPLSNNTTSSTSHTGTTTTHRRHHTTHSSPPTSQRHQHSKKLSPSDGFLEFHSRGYQRRQRKLAHAATTPTTTTTTTTTSNSSHGNSIKSPTTILQRPQNRQPHPQSPATSQLHNHQPTTSPPPVQPAPSCHLISLEHQQLITKYMELEHKFHMLLQQNQQLLESNAEILRRLPQLSLPTTIPPSDISGIDSDMVIDSIRTAATKRTQLDYANENSGLDPSAKRARSSVPPDCTSTVIPLSSLSHSVLTN